MNTQMSKTEKSEISNGTNVRYVYKCAKVQMLTGFIVQSVENETE